jgi:hypothetical protein
MRVPETLGQYLDAISCAPKSILESPGIVTGYRMLVVNCALIGTPNDGSSPRGLPFVPPLAAFEYGGV